MRRLLVISPHFPPSDAVDMHRVRVNLCHYENCGWSPSVLSVSAAMSGRQLDERLLRSVPATIAVTRVSAFPEGFARLAGLTALGLRAYFGLARAGDRLISDAAASGRPFDLAFFSTTAFPAMALGPRWRQLFGLPYVLDMQDPWYTAPVQSQVFRRLGLKHHAMRAIHRRLEAATMPNAAGLIAVSPHYIEALRMAYPTLRDRPAETIPFGWSQADMALARTLGKPWNAIEAARRDGAVVAISAGRAGPYFSTALRALFRLIAAAPPGGTLARLKAMFLGTGYQSSGNRFETMPLAAAEGVANCVEEQPDRLPLLDALASLDAADVLIVLGSDDFAYQPSKLYQYLAFEKAVLVIAPAGSRVAAQVEDLDGVIFVEAGARSLTPERIADIDALLARALSASQGAFPRRVMTSASHESAARAAEECALFDAACDRAVGDTRAGLTAYCCD